jgi:hypothetical protein
MIFDLTDHSRYLINVLYLFCYKYHKTPHDMNLVHVCVLRISI